MPTYTRAPRDVMTLLARAIHDYHPALRDLDITIGVLCAVAAIDEETGRPKGPALMHHGYPAAATIKVNSAKDRVEGKTDATIVLDYDRWPEMSEAEQLALLDHELQHLEPAGATDDAGRPKIRMRQHDFEVGGFDAVIDRHGTASIEAQFCHAVAQKVTQRLFPFGEDPGRNRY